MKRLQRTRRHGWRLPEGAVIVTRPSRWGNPFLVQPGDGPVRRAEAVDGFRRYAAVLMEADADWLHPLRGRDLACWCPLDQPCHADVLLELANR